ncbi:MAG: hypothetical protein Kow00121_49720 [Elainellaceae cyanobacterium]
MSQTNQSFKAAEIGQRFETACSAFNQLLQQDGSANSQSIQRRLADELIKYKEQGILSIALIGQYSAGKSTIISALTGRRDIRIDADIATDKTASYDWNQIRLIDTPGLFTDRADHDAITYEAIAKADLLVFCLTYMLFDSITIENFKKLAYEKGYRWKMMLVINKMSDEAGEEDQKITNYRQSLAEALKPHSLDEFPISFIDAKDYCDGIDEEDDFLVEISRFQTFISELNQFVEHRATLAQFDTPVRIALSCLDEAQISFTRNSNGDAAFLELLSRLSRVVLKERDRLRTKVKGITLNMASEVIGEGRKLAAAVGTDADFDSLNKQAEINVQNYYEQAGKELHKAAEAAFGSVRLEVEKILQSDLTQAFIARLNFDQQISAQNSKSGSNTEQLRTQIDWLQKIGSKVGAALHSSATRQFVSTAGSGFLRSMDVAGSQLHQAVYGVGKFIGFKFKPWQAVGMAKNIGNAAMFLGPALAVVSIGMDVYTTHQEYERERKMAEIRKDITSQFQAVAKDLECQIESNLREFESKVYGKIEQDIATARQQEENSIATSNQWVKLLAEVRRQLEAIIADIAAVSTTENN